MNLKALDVWLTPYELDEQYDVLFIQLEDDPTCSLVGFIEVPDGAPYEILTRENIEGKIAALEIIYPEEFLRSLSSNEIFFEGINLKTFVLESMNLN